MHAIETSTYPFRNSARIPPNNNIAIIGFETTFNNGNRTCGINNTNDTTVSPRAISESFFISYYLNTENEIYTKRV